MDLLGGVNDFLVAAGSAEGSFIRKAMSGVADFACQLHHDYPGVIYDLNPINKGLWQSLCSQRPAGLPPPPPPPLYLGGQCPGVAYRVIYTSQTTAQHPSGAGYTTTRQVDAPGPITNFTYAYRSDGVGYRAELDYQNGHYLFPQDGGGNGWRELQSVSVTRIDGQPDNCGNIPTPVVRPIVLPPEQRTTNINITNNDGSNISLPVSLSFPSASVDFNLSVPMTINLGGFNFHLNLDGWHFGLPGGGSTAINDVKTTVDNVYKSINNYNYPPNPGDDNTLVLISPSGEKPGDEQKSLPKPRWLVIDLTKLPDKAQYGINSPTIYFAGWVSFLKEGKGMPREQINYQQAIFRFPDGADGYAYTFTNGAAGKVSVYVEKGS